MKSKLSECPLCGSRAVEKHIGSLKVRISKGSFIRIPNIEYEKCKKCGETVTDYKSEKKIDAFLKLRQKAA